MAQTYKLTYFNLKALAEPIRFIFSYCGVEFEDVRVEKEDWPQLKPTTPFGQLPVLETNGMMLYQSPSICRYLAKKFKLVGGDDEEAFEIDAIVDTIHDLMLEIWEYHYQLNEEVKETLKNPLFEETIPYYMERFDAIVKKNNGYLAIGKLTWADLYLIGILDYFNFMTGMNLFEDYPALTALEKNVLNQSGIRQWVAKRPVTVF